ncbi:putative Glycosyltransferase (GlcNAc) [Leishmania utingensis]|uniref:Glycosyltransferase (GlcNAc) n=1 Tax=Leishmania utingensis TaxID=653362 RepID=A0AAW3AP11_9TRYP
MRDYSQVPSVLKRPLRMPRRRLSVRRRQAILAVIAILCLCVLSFMYFLSTSPVNEHRKFSDIPSKPWFTAEENATRFAQVVQGRTPGTTWRDATFNMILSLSKSGDTVYMTPTNYTRYRRTTDGNPGDFRKWESIYRPGDRYHVPSWATPADRATLHHASIFVSLASFRDHECALTLRNLFDMSASPHRLYVGVSEERRSSDASCLSRLGMDDLESGETRRVLYGAEAPASLGVEVRTLTWADVLAPRRLLDVDAVLSTPAVSAEGIGVEPDGVFVHPAHAAERVLCVAGELETARDTLLTGEEDAKSAIAGQSVFRKGRGGPQQQPSRALAGCRVTTRVTDASHARGPTFGRYITSLFFFNQDYFMVVDSHTRFSVDWDMKLITRVFQLPTRGVLSNYPNGYREGHDREEFEKTDVMFMCTAQVLSNGMPKLGARWMPLSPRPVLQGFAAAGFMFGDAQFTLDTPFDPFLPYMFDGEEVLYSARMWTAGWDLYGPGQPDVFHHYSRPNTPKYFGIMTPKEAARRLLSEKRTLYLLRRAQPWIEELVHRGYVSPNGQSTLKPLPSAPPPETRLIVTDEVASATREINVWSKYYGMGAERSVSSYWQHTELSDEFVKTKDNENRWMGGIGLCEKGAALM